MKTFALSVLVWVLLAPASMANEQVKFTGDQHKAKQVWNTFEKWLAAYSGGDQAGVMAVFDKEVEFSYQGTKDQSYGDLEAAYSEDFANRKPGTEWVPLVEEVYAEGKLALVRAVWELKVRSPEGKTESRARNRSMDVFRLAEDGKWRIFRSMNFPEQN